MVGNVPHLLSRHDESSANIPVFYKSLTVRKLQLLSQVQGSDTRCIRYLMLMIISQIRSFEGAVSRTDRNDDIYGDLLL